MTETKESRNWCYTLNNPTHDELIILQCLFEDNYATYHVMGDEVGTKTHTPHIQGYLHTKHLKSFNQVKNKLSHRIHLEQMIGTSQQASDYCKKEGKYIEYGTLPKNGAPPAKVNSATIILAINEGKTLEEIEELYPTFMLFHRNKVVDQIKQYNLRRNKDIITKYFIIDQDDPLTDVEQSLPGCKAIIIDELQDIEGYASNDYDTVIYNCSFYEKKHNMWPRGMKIIYKDGWQVKTISCKNFVISTNHIKLYDKQLWINLSIHDE